VNPSPDADSVVRVTDSLSSTLPDWIAAVASTLAFAAAGLAIYPAWRAFRLEQKRDDRAEVETFSVWWASHPRPGVSGKKDWGLIVSNSGHRVLWNIDIGIVSRSRPKPASVQMLPPGRYFMHSNETSWDFVTEISSDSQEYSPITDAKTHKVTGYSLTDSSGTRWSWEPASGIRRSR
jgi:hypothetical protein